MKFSTVPATDLRAGESYADDNLWKGYEVIAVTIAADHVRLSLHDPLLLDRWHVVTISLPREARVYRIDDADLVEFLAICGYVRAVVHRAEPNPYPFAV